MSEGSLFNSGFLGESFLWWVGQIADDATWRDNILPGKFESANQIPGWGRRYKVRIIGLHDQGETEIASDQLPWAQVMYPVTGGGGQGASGTTSNLRQGNMVFGFFLDGQDQQVPVIMGVLGNNAQTKLSTKIGDGRVTNTRPGSLATSGNAVSASGNTDQYRKVPDDDKTISKPTSTGTPSASPTSPAAPGAAKESVDAVHQQSAADIKRLDLYLKKTVMLSPCDLPGSAMKGMQTEIENLTNAIDKILKTVQNYTDAVSEVTSQVSDIVGQVGGIVGSVGTGSCPQGSAGSAIGVAEKIQALLERFAPKIAKYMKVIFNKIFEYTSKQINKAIGSLADAMFPNQRPKFLDMKIGINESIKCLFSKITGGLLGQILSSLKNILNKCNPSSNNNAPFIPICSVEELTGNIIAANMGDIDTTITEVIKSVETFVGDIQSGLDVIENITDQISGISGQIGSISQSLGGINIPNIAGSIASALSFENIVLSIFGCDTKPNCAASDFYTLQEGGGAAEEEPRPANVTETSANPSSIPPPDKKLDFDKPNSNSNNTAQAQAAAKSERDLERQGIVNTLQF